MHINSAVSSKLKLNQNNAFNTLIIPKRYQHPGYHMKIKFNRLKTLRHSMSISDVSLNIVLHSLLFRHYSAEHPLYCHSREGQVWVSMGGQQLGTSHTALGPTIAHFYSLVPLYISIESLYYNHYWSKEADVWWIADWCSDCLLISLRVLCWHDPNCSED